MSATENSQLHPNAKQCAFIKIDGTQCGSPAQVNHGGDGIHCHFHFDHQERLFPKHVTLPPLEDGNAIQAATTTVLNALLYDRIDKSKATGLLYGLQLAQNNLKHMTLAPKQEDQASRAAAKADEDYESLSAYLLRELRATETPVRAGEVSVHASERKAGSESNTGSARQTG